MVGFLGVRDAAESDGTWRFASGEARVAGERKCNQLACPACPLSNTGNEIHNGGRIYMLIPKTTAIDRTNKMNSGATAKVALG